MSDGAAPVLVRGSAVPDLLLDLLRAGRWRHPGTAALTRAMPWFEDPLDFLSSTSAMERQSRYLDDLMNSEENAQLFKLARGSTTDPVRLPWLDIDRAFCIAVAHYAGDETAVALDYRTSSSDPCVVANDCWTSGSEMSWRVVAPTFSDFVSRIGLTGTP